MDGGTAWWQTVAGTAGGALFALAIAAGGWWVNRRRLRKAIALVLFFETKFVRLDWVGGLERGGNGRGYAPLLSSWRNLQHAAADLLPRRLVGQLTELAWWIDRVSTGTVVLTVPEGVADVKAIAARAERDLARRAGEPFDAATDKWLTQHEARFGSKP